MIFMKNKKIKLLMYISCGILLIAAAKYTVSNFIIKSYVLETGGGIDVSSEYKNYFSIGQSCVNPNSTSLNSNYTGFINALFAPVKLNNDTPVSDAGHDTTVTMHDLVALDCSNSSDPDSDFLIYIWSQISGNVVLLNDTGLTKPTFTPVSEGIYILNCFHCVDVNDKNKSNF